MNIIKTPIEGLLVIEPQVFKDARGYFVETYNKRDFEEAGDGDRYAAFMDERLPRGVANRMMLSEGLGWGLLNAELNRQCLRYGNNYLKVIDKTSIDKTP